MSVMQTRADGTPPPDGKPTRPTKARRKGKAGTPKKRPARRKKTPEPANKAAPEHENK